MKDAKIINASHQPCSSISQISSGTTLTLNNHSEYSNTRQAISVGQVYSISGWHISINLSKGTDLMELVWREQDQCLKEFLKKYQRVNVKFSISYMRSLRKNLGCILMRLRFMIGWLIMCWSRKDFKLLISILRKFQNFQASLKLERYSKQLFRN